MNDTISIKKVTHNNREYPGIKFNPDEQITIGFIQEAIFMMMVSAIQPLSDEHKKIFLQTMRDSVLKVFNKPEEEVFDFFINQCKVEFVKKPTEEL
jgi:hypothetical protein